MILREKIRYWYKKKCSFILNQFVDFVYLLYEKFVNCYYILIICEIFRCRFYVRFYLIYMFGELCQNKGNWIYCNLF